MDESIISKALGELPYGKINFIHIGRTSQSLLRRRSQFIRGNGLAPKNMEIKCLYKTYDLGKVKYLLTYAITLLKLAEINCGYKLITNGSRRGEPPTNQEYKIYVLYHYE